MQTLFRVAKAKSPAIMFFDEIDHLTETRAGEDSSFERRSKNHLLTLFGLLSRDSSVLIMGATNRLWDIDSAFLSRFQQRIFFGLPDSTVKLEILIKDLEDDRHTLEKGDHGALEQLLRQKAVSGRDIAAALGRVR